MINAKDVRLGNWIYGTDGKEHQVTLEALTYLLAEPDYNQCKPIGISPERLVRAKFIKDNYGVFEKTKDNINSSESVFELWLKQCEVEGKLVWDVSIGQDFGDITPLCYIEFIHQLQNIYYCLTGKELEFQK